MDDQQTRTAVIRAAVRAWRDGKPHRAREIMVAAGYGDLWPTFQRAAFRAARGRFVASMARARRR